MTTKTLTAAALLLALAACTKPAADASATSDAPAAATATGEAPGDIAGTTMATLTVDPSVARTAAALAKAVDAWPAKTDSILGVNHYTPDSFERLLLAIAADSASAAAYAAAMR